MRRQTITRRCVVAIVSGIALGVFVDSTAAQGKVQPIPSFSDVQKAVWQYFQKQDDFQPGDLLSRDQVEPLFPQLQRMGLPLADAKQILESLPSKDEFLVQQLRTPGGKKFMRRIAADPNAYDRLDRLSRMPHGQQTIRDLIKGPGGEKLIDYMTKTSGGAALGRMLADTPDGSDFNAPTNRTYTVDDLLNRLRQSRAAAVQRASGSQSTRNAGR
jgi:hypothetical protein